MTKIEILQKEAREKLSHLVNSNIDFDMEKYQDDLISSVYQAAIEDAKGVIKS